MGKLLCSLLTAFCALAVSCGQIGAPLPPLLNIPARAEAFRAQQMEDRVAVAWVPPRTTTEGAALNDLSRFIVYAAEIGRGGPPPSAESMEGHFRVVADVPGDTESAEIPVSDRYGQRTAFAVRGISTKGKMSLWSDVAVLEIVAPPGAPSNLRAETTQDGISLAWSPAEGASDYIVERAEGGGNLSVVGGPKETTFLDGSARFGAAYRYRVRGRAESPTGGVPGPPSVGVNVTPVDAFPPTPPQGIRAVRTPQSVELSWSGSPEADLAGYVIERDGNSLHEGLLSAAAFSDPDAPVPATYAIRAVDQAGNRSGAASITVE